MFVFQGYCLPWRISAIFFQEMGKHKSKIQDDEQNETGNPKAVGKPQPAAYHLEEPLQKWLLEGVDVDLFEQIPHREAITCT